MAVRQDLLIVPRRRTTDFASPECNHFTFCWWQVLFPFQELLNGFEKSNYQKFFFKSNAFVKTYPMMLTLLIIDEEGDGGLRWCLNLKQVNIFNVWFKQDTRHKATNTRACLFTRWIKKHDWINPPTIAALQWQVATEVKISQLPVLTVDPNVQTGAFLTVFTVILTTLNNTRQCFYQSKRVDSFWLVNVLYYI